MKDIEKMFFTNTSYVLRKLRETEKINLTQLSSKTNITYSHIFKIVTYLSDKGLIETIKIGRVRYISLSKKGRHLSNVLSSAFGLVKKLE